MLYLEKNNSFDSKLSVEESTEVSEESNDKISLENSKGSKSTLFSWPSVPETYKWLRHITIEQLPYLEPINELRLQHRFFTPKQLTAFATNSWFCKTEKEKSELRHPDLGNEFNYYHKIQQYNFNLHVKQENWRINNYVEFLADYYSYNKHLGPEEAIRRGDIEWRKLLNQKIAPQVRLMSDAKTTRPSNMRTTYKLLQNFAFFIWGRSFARFYRKYRKFHKYLHISQALRQTIFFWNIMPLSWKERYLKDY